MEFNEKLQELRRSRGLTQEQLAAALYVSCTAVSKWEQGKGYPSIDTLKKIAELFSLTVDELLSGEKLLSIAEVDSSRKRRSFTYLAFGLLDISALSLLFLPFFAEKSGEVIRSVSLIYLSSVSVCIKIAFYAFTALLFLHGVLTLALQNCEMPFWVKSKGYISLFLSLAFTLILILSRQPYAAIFLFLFLIIKAVILIKK